jgi:general nucleoside transport system permease protein
LDDGAVRGRGWTRELALGIGILVIALAIPGLAVLLAGKSPFAAFAAMIFYTLGTHAGFAEVVVRAIPLTLMGLGVAVAFRAGIFNVGGDGQLIVGAIAAVTLSPWLGLLPAPLGIIAFLTVGFVAGGLLGAVVGWLRARFEANEIIVTIMLNYVALQLLTWAIRGPLQEKMHFMPNSFPIPTSLELPLLIADSRVHAGLVVALLAALILYVVLRHTSFGFKLAVIGENREVAPFAGIADHRIIVLAMLVSGGLAGLAGAVEIAGIHHKLQDDFAGGYGLASIAVALMARLSPIFIPFAALLFGVFYVGAGALQRQAGIPFPIVWIIEGVVILAFLGYGALGRRGAMAR